MKHSPQDTPDQNNETYISDIKLNELMLRLGFHWVEPNLWVLDGDFTHLHAREVLRLYEEDV